MTSSYKDVSEWYDRQYRESGDDSRRSAHSYQQILDQLPVAENVLDVGCGRGEFLSFLSQKGYKKLAGVDLSKEAIEHLAKKLPDCRAEVAKGEELPFEKESFDLLTCLGSLEHFLDIPKGLSEMFRVLKEGGKAVIMVPNADFIAWNFTSEHSTGTAQREISETLYSVKKWRQLIEGSGLVVTNVVADKGFIYNKHDLRKKGPKYYLKRLLFVFMPILPKAWTYQVIFTAVKIKPS